MSSFHRGRVWCAAYGCSNTYNKRKPGMGWDFFSVSEAADAVSREVECLLTWPIVSCSLDDQYVQYSAKRGLLWTTGTSTLWTFGVGKGV